MIAPAQTLPASYLAFDGERRDGARALPVEHPVNIVYGGVPYAVMMATPQDLEDFIVGFSLTEGIIGGADDIRDIRFEDHPRGLRALATLSPEVFGRHLARQRAMSGRTGCGVCGVQDLDSLPAARRVEPAPPIALAAIARAVEAVEHHQPMNDETRAVHAAAWFDRNGFFVMAREDVGRHNALDKLIGALLREKIAPAAGFVLITSRCSFEMVEKAAAFGAATLVAISAPTSLAVARARELGVSVYAIARKDGVTRFTAAEGASLEICA